MKISTKSQQSLYTEANGGTKAELKKKTGSRPVAAAACSLSPFEDEKSSLNAIYATLATNLLVSDIYDSDD